MLKNFVTAALVVGAIVVLILLANRFLFVPDASTQAGTLTEQEWDTLQTKGHLIGVDDAPVHVALFADMDCPFSQDAYQHLTSTLEQYNGEVALSYHHLTWVDETSRGFKAARAAQCAARQGSFVPFIDAAYTNRSAYKNRNWNQLAEHADLEELSAFESCLSSDADSAHVARDVQQAHAFGFVTTPTIVASRKVYTGAQTLPNVDALISDRVEEITP